MSSPVEKGMRYEEKVVSILKGYGLEAFRTNKANESDPVQYKAGFDGGVDVIAKFSTTETKVYKDFVFYIQCKDHKADLTKSAIEEVYAGMHARNAKSPNCIPVVFSSSEATKETRQFAMGLGVELFLPEHDQLLEDAKKGIPIPYSNYGVLLKILLSVATKDKTWLDTLPDYQSKINNLTSLDQQLIASEIDFDEAQALLDEAAQYERKAQAQRQKSLDIQRMAVMRTLQASNTATKKFREMKTADNDLDGG
jgi:hypothetical protein